MNLPFLPRYNAAKVARIAVIIWIKDQSARVLIVVCVVLVYAGVPVLVGVAMARAF